MRYLSQEFLSIKAQKAVIATQVSEGLLTSAWISNNQPQKTVVLKLKTCLPQVKNVDLYDALQLYHNYSSLLPQCTFTLLQYPSEQVRLDALRWRMVENSEEQKFQNR